MKVVLGYSGMFTITITITSLGFPDSSVGKESACSARDPSSIPG